MKRKDFKNRSNDRESDRPYRITARSTPFSGKNFEEESGNGVCTIRLSRIEK